MNSKQIIFPNQLIKKILESTIFKLYSLSLEHIDCRRSTNLVIADYQTSLPVLIFKTLEKKSQIAITEEIIDCIKNTEDLKAKNFDYYFESIFFTDAKFINFKLSNQYLSDLANYMTKNNIRPPNFAKKLRIVVDYSSPNVAKEMHIGHIRSTIIGDAIVRILKYVGRHKIIPQNHVGDWGTQFGMLIEYILQKKINIKKIEYSQLNTLYQSAKLLFDNDQNFSMSALERVVKLQNNDKKTNNIWNFLIKLSYKHFQKNYKRLRVLLKLKDIKAESSYQNDLKHICDLLEEKKLAFTHDGALVAYANCDSNVKNIPFMIRKKDGGYLYSTTDLAAIKYRAEKLKADMIIYVTDIRQKQHFDMLFAVARNADFVNANVVLKHEYFGSILGDDKKPFKTRSGTVISLTDLLDEAWSRAYEITKTKNPSLPHNECEKIADILSVSAIKYADLRADKVKDYIFEWDKILAFNGNTALYLQNAYVRIKSLLKKAASLSIVSLKKAIDDVNYYKLAIDSQINISSIEEREIILQLILFIDIVQTVANNLKIHILCMYLYDLADKFHNFYEKCQILDKENKFLTNSRVCICFLAEKVFRDGFKLLGIDLLDYM